MDISALLKSWSTWLRGLLGLEAAETRPSGQEEADAADPLEEAQACILWDIEYPDKHPPKKEEGKDNGTLNLIPGFDCNTGNFREYKRIFDEFGIEEDIRAAFRRRVDLKSGGYIVIGVTEALVTGDGITVGKIERVHMLTRGQRAILQTTLDALSRARPTIEIVDAISELRRQLATQILDYVWSWIDAGSSRSIPEMDL